MASLPSKIRTFPQDAVKERGFFYAGGSSYESGGKHYLENQMYVEVYVPQHLTKPYPLVLLHGADQTGLCWMTTAQGGPGWTDFFLRQGYLVYVVDQPSRGRSCAHPEREGKRIVFSAEETAAVFTTREGAHPQAVLHTQWPGTGQPGDPIYDAFYAAQADSLYDIRETQEKVRASGRALLETIGPAILVAHSQAGPFAWFLADDSPELVRGIVAIEPSGPPFVSAQTGELIQDKDGNPENYGISHVPLTFDPPISGPGELKLRRVPAPRTGLMDGYLQQEPARRLPNLARIPTLVLTSESSYHAPYDYWTAAFLQQAGVPAEYVNLADVGIRGNGHMMMLENNASEIAAWLCRWLEEHVQSKARQE